MTAVHGFELVAEREIPEINSWARLYRHQRTGAELVSVENSDENKSFGVGFKTPPPDATGLPHILEHSVLNGSRKYPVKEPFVELLKSSLKTFLNAITFDDMTIYPVASTNLRDFYNLVDVYMDAVFYPLIDEMTFQQEGWHYELDAPDGTLTYRGVVFNEMKAAYAVPERVLGNISQAALLPDTPYASDAGGDPSVMPNLTYAQFKHFHETYYHPSNARFFFYGDDDPVERLRMVDEFIAEFGAHPVDATLPLQTKFDAPRQIRAGYDAGEAGADENKAMVTVNWLLPEITDRQQILALQILEHILIDTPASPLRKALIDSGLGEDLTGGGLSTYQRQATFGVGLKGASGASAERIEGLILNTLGNLAEEGIDPGMIEAALNTTEFQLRELNTGAFPRGLMLMIMALPTWMHGGDPLSALAFADRLENIKQAAASNPRYFEEMIARHLLDNPHRVTVTLEPDPTIGPKRDEAELKRLADAQSTMAPDDLLAIFEQTQRLQARQQQPDRPEDLAKIPVLRLSDIEREAKVIPIEVQDAAGATLLYHDLPTNGIAYIDMGFDLRGLPADLLPYAGIFGKVLLQMGTEKQDYVQLSQRIGARTGGISADTLVSPRRQGPEALAQLMVSTKAMPEQIDDLLDILGDVLLNVKLDNRERFKQLVLESKASGEAYIGVIGHVLAGRRLRAHFDEAGWISEQIEGFSQLFFLRELAKKIDSSWDEVLAALEAVRSYLINRGGALLNVTLDAENWSAQKDKVARFVASLPAGSTNGAAGWDIPTLPDREAFTIPAQVNSVAKATNLYAHGYELKGSHVAIVKFMNLDYMWNKIRVMGGAYGGAMRFDSIGGLATFMSWRDPNLVGTLNNYDAAASYLQSIELDSDTLEKAIIGAIGDLDSYQLPDAKGRTSMMRYLTGLSDEMRQQTRDELLTTTVDDFRAFGDVLARAVAAGKVAVVGGPEAVKKANAELNPPLDVTKVL